MKKSALFTKDFTILVVGQIISLFGNSILRFSLSLFVLDKTGSAAVFWGNPGSIHDPDHPAFPVWGDSGGQG